MLMGRGDFMNNANDLTNGKVSAKLLGFFFPMLLTNLFQQIYSVADTAIVGKGLGDNALGAVGNLSSLSLLIIGFSMGMTSGFAVIIAQDYGSGDRKADQIGRKNNIERRIEKEAKSLLTLGTCPVCGGTLSHSFDDGGLPMIDCPEWENTLRKRVIDILGNDKIKDKSDDSTFEKT